MKQHFISTEFHIFSFRRLTFASGFRPSRPEKFPIAVEYDAGFQRRCNSTTFSPVKLTFSPANFCAISVVNALCSARSPASSTYPAFIAMTFRRLPSGLGRSRLSAFCWSRAARPSSVSHRAILRNPPCRWIPFSKGRATFESLVAASRAGELARPANRRAHRRKRGTGARRALPTVATPWRSTTTSRRHRSTSRDWTAGRFTRCHWAFARMLKAKASAPYAALRSSPHDRTGPLSPRRMHRGISFAHPFSGGTLLR